jgi:hypothetical protein
MDLARIPSSYKVVWSKYLAGPAVTRQVVLYARAHLVWRPQAAIETDLSESETCVRPVDKQGTNNKQRYAQISRGGSTGRFITNRNSGEKIMSTKPRPLPAMGAALVFLTIAATAGAADPGKKVQKPDQVLTGASDAAVTTAAPAARSAASARTSAPSAEELDSRLAASYSESSSGLHRAATVGCG